MKGSKYFIKHMTRHYTGAEPQYQEATHTLPGICIVRIDLNAGVKETIKVCLSHADRYL